MALCERLGHLPARESCFGALELLRFPATHADHRHTSVTASPMHTHAWHTCRNHVYPPVERPVAAAGAPAPGDACSLVLVSRADLMKRLAAGRFRLDDCLPCSRSVPQYSTRNTRDVSATSAMAGA